MAHVNSKHGKQLKKLKKKKKEKRKNTKRKIKCVGGGGGIFTICSVWSLTHCHSWNNHPCIHNRSPSSPPAKDLLLQPSPSSPTPPQFQKRKTEAATG